jgi:hypothetical protein
LKKPFTHRATASFWNHYRELLEETRQVADENFQILKDNLYHPSLHFKCIKDDLWSVRVGIQHRALALAEDCGFAWIWIGHHSEYDRLIK